MYLYGILPKRLLIQRAYFIVIVEIDENVVYRLPIFAERTGGGIYLIKKPWNGFNGSIQVIN